jgi:sodium/bile acid cotransporter 7
MCVLLTASAGGNVAASLANAVMGNMLGIFVTPALLMYFFGTAIELPFLQMVLKLVNKVLVPVAVGQVLRATQAKDFFVSHKKSFKSLQEVCRKFDVFMYCYSSLSQSMKSCIFIMLLVYSGWFGMECILQCFYKRHWY